MPFTAEAITLTEDERAELEQMTQPRTLPAGDMFRARLILMLADGVPYRKIQEQLDTTAYHHPLEAPFLESAHGWAAGDPTSRTKAIGDHTGLSGEDPGGEPA